MPVYMIFNETVTDPAVFESYRTHAGPLFVAAGGKHLVRGGAVTAVEGTSPFNRLVVLEFATMDALKAFYHSPEYAPLIVMRQKASTGDVVLVEGFVPPA